MRFQDFAPQRSEAMTRFLGLSIPSAQIVGSFEECVAAARAWVEQNEVEVINVETVVLPNIYRSGEEGTSDPELRTSGDMHSRWYQFVRVWYW